jgi:NTP pyrophosphatase (non-canonical NTP hydrolase)
MDLKEHQQRIEETYLDRDRKRGLDKTFIWFVEEVGELAKALREKEGLKSEFADVLAWLLSVANLAKIDLDEAMERFQKGCPKCKSSPCLCPEG